MKTILIKVFGVPREERPPEFYETNRWRGQTPAEARFVRTMQIILGVAALSYVAWYWLLR
jgi:hypothetical protein